MGRDYELRSKTALAIKKGRQRSWNMGEGDFRLTINGSFAVAELVRVWKGWEGEFRFVQNLTISATRIASAELESRPNLILVSDKRRHQRSWNMRE